MIVWLWRSAGCRGKSVQVRLSFLGEGRYKALVVRDSKQSDAAVVVENKEVGRDDTLTLEMIDGGGFVGRFTGE